MSVVKKPHKILQEMYHATNKIDNHVENLPVEFCEDTDDVLKKHIMDYFTKPQDHLVIPAKSYCVAIIYSFLLLVHFDEGIYSSLNDPDLFMGTDKYFVPYSERPEIYDYAIIERAVFISLHGNNLLPHIQSTFDYFMKEFYIGEPEYDAIMKSRLDAT